MQYDSGELTQLGDERNEPWADRGLLIKALAWHPHNGVADVIAYDLDDREYTIRYWYTPKVMVFAPPPTDGDPYAMPISEAEVMQRLGNRRAILPPPGQHLYLWRTFSDNDNTERPFVLFVPSLSLIPNVGTLYRNNAQRKYKLRLTARCR